MVHLNKKEIKDTLLQDSTKVFMNAIDEEFEEITARVFSDRIQILFGNTMLSFYFDALSGEINKVAGEIYHNYEPFFKQVAEDLYKNLIVEGDF